VDIDALKTRVEALEHEVRMLSESSTSLLEAPRSSQPVPLRP